VGDAGRAAAAGAQAGPAAARQALPRRRWRAAPAGERIEHGRVGI
jgi:hypothetical protein